MSKLTDKVSYLKGLAAGMKLNMEKDSNKLLLGYHNYTATWSGVSGKMI